MRAFVAINLPSEERVRLHAALAPLRALDLPVKWTGPESLHLTLKFLGNIDERQASTVKRILQDVAMTSDAFDMQLGGIGAFPRLDHPRVWWVGISEQPVLLRVQQDLELALEREGFAREERAFSPHVTIGHSRKGAERSARCARDVARTVDFSGQVRVNSIDLMQSHLSHQGSRYERLLAAALRHGQAAESRKAEVP
jgi:2'-5' RNA ligase